MMFALDAAFALGLLALVAGTILLMLSGREGMAARGFGKAVAYLTIIAAILTLLCTTYYGVRYWVDGYLEHPHGMAMKGGMMKCPMMERGMKCPMMEGGMGGKGMMKDKMGHGMMQKGMEDEEPGTESEDVHSEHH